MCNQLSKQEQYNDYHIRAIKQFSKKTTNWLLDKYSHEADQTMAFEAVICQIDQNNQFMNQSHSKKHVLLFDWPQSGGLLLFTQVNNIIYNSIFNRVSPLAPLLAYFQKHYTGTA